MPQKFVGSKTRLYLCTAFEKAIKAARSSRGQDTRFSFLEQGFDSPTGYYQSANPLKRVCAFCI